MVCYFLIGYELVELFIEVPFEKIPQILKWLLSFEAKMALLRKR